MNPKIAIQIKALFLLLLFSLNTVIGFACAMGVDMGFNTPHHENDAEATEVHVHADGKKHHHNQEPLKVSPHVHQDGSKHHHDNNESANQPTDENQPVKDSKDCCNGEVQKFQSVDKNLNQSTTLSIPVFTAIVSTFFGIDIFNINKSHPPKYKARFYYPPPPDIRIEIQSFQI